jgi:cell division protease FtsH
VQVSRTAKAMVTQMGMSKKLGQVAWTSSGGPSFVGQSMGQPSDCSGETADEIDAEVKALVERAYRCALKPAVIGLWLGSKLGVALRMCVPDVCLM